MITYKDASNANDYTFLFGQASMKLGLIPIQKAVLDELGNQATDSNGDPLYTYWRMKWDEAENKWIEEELQAEDMDKNHNIVERDEEGNITTVLHGISTLNEYFQHISELATLAMGPLHDTGDGEDVRHGSDPYLLRLPLDEPYFEINANTRAITVPSALSQIGVVGDKYAEIVFFKIDRYFDAVDLDTRHIYIEWEAPGANGETIKGISRDFLRDTQSEKGKIIFGWLIDDRLTQAVGTIRFAVRFVEWSTSADSAAEGTQLGYSFSSLPAQINVVDSLHYDLFDGAGDKDWTAVSTQKIRNMQLYFENSVPDADDSTQPGEADAPRFIRDINDGEEWATVPGNDNIYQHDLTGPANEASLELITEAYSPDSGVLSYVYARQEDLTTGPEAIGTKVIFKKYDLTTEIGNDNKVIYYKLKDGTSDTFELASDTELNSAIRLNGHVEVYEKVARTLVKQPGYYYAIVRNTAAAKKTGRAESKKVYIPKAEPFMVDEEHPMPKYFVLGKQDYTVAPDTSKYQNDNTSNLKVIATPAEDYALQIELGGDTYGPKFIAPGDNKDRFASVSYEWFKDGVKIPNESMPTYTVTESGVYTAKVTSVFNNSEAELKPEEIGSITVLDTPSMPELDFDAWEAMVQVGNTTTEIPVVEPADGGIIKYKWHRVTVDQTDMDSAEGYMQDVEGIVTNGVIPFKPSHPGYFYLILTHQLLDDEGNVLAETVRNAGEDYGIIRVETETPVYQVTFTSVADKVYTEDIMDTLPQITPLFAQAGNYSPMTPDNVEVPGLGTWTFVSWDEAPKLITNAPIAFIATWTFEEATSEDDTPESF